jgi:hypothetical protein
MEEEAILIHQLKPAYNHNMPQHPEDAERERRAYLQRQERIWGHFPEFDQQAARKRKRVAVVVTGHSGVLRGRGECVHCGGVNCITLDADGFHLTPPAEAEEDE